MLRRFSADTPHRTVRAVFPHTALRVGLVSSVSLPFASRLRFTLIPMDAPPYGRAVSDAPPHSGLSPIAVFRHYSSRHLICIVPFFTQRPFAPLLASRLAFGSGDTHGHCPASPLLRPHPTTAFAFANCSPPKFPCRTFEARRHLCPAASTLPESSQQGDVGFTSTETLTTRKHLTRLYVGSSLALRPIPLSGKTPAHRSPFARLAVLIVCRFLYDIAPSAISSAELCLAYLWQSGLTLFAPWHSTVADHAGSLLSPEAPFQVSRA